MTRRKTRSVRMGNVEIGAGAPVSVQSMTKTHTEDTDGTLRQIRELAAVGCDIVRVAVPTTGAAKALGRIVRDSPVPIEADVHFSVELALAALRSGVHGLRVNPGNLPRSRDVWVMLELARERGIPIRVGANSGSIVPRKGPAAHAGVPDIAMLMVERSLELAREFESRGFRDIVLSLKASDVPTTVRAYREAAKRCDYPFHLGVTAGGPPETAAVKSAVALGLLLGEGIGDTIRVSMTGPPTGEVLVGRQILSALGLAREGPELISCPGCGRCEIDLVGIVREVQEGLTGMKAPIRVAVMGCVVNGPGEASDADVGIAGGKDFGVIFRRGKVIGKVQGKRLARSLLEEVRSLVKSQHGGRGQVRQEPRP